MHITSPPCRAVLLTAAAIGLELEHKIINYLNAEQKSPEYIKVNWNFCADKEKNRTAIENEQHLFEAIRNNLKLPNTPNVLELFI